MCYVCNHCNKCGRYDLVERCPWCGFEGAREHGVSLCPKCGKNLNEGPCGCDLRQIDPRLAVLQKLLDQQKENK